MKTKVKMILMSHLSDIQMDVYLDQKSAVVRAKFAKHLIMKYGDDLNQEINPEKEFEIFNQPK